MLDLLTDGRLHVTAGIALLESSRLVRFGAQPTRFSTVEHSGFEASCSSEIDPVFGRLVCWITFSAGAEMLAKGVCLLRNIEIRAPKTVPVYPTGNITAWADEFTKDSSSAGAVSYTHLTLPTKRIV